MATIRKLRGRWQAQVRRRGMAPRAKSFDKKSDAERWARDLEAEVARCGWLPDTRAAETTTLAAILERYLDEITPLKRSAKSETLRINGILRRPICHRTLIALTSADLASYRDRRLKTVAGDHRKLATRRERKFLSEHAVDYQRADWSSGYRGRRGPYGWASYMEKHVSSTRVRLMTRKSIVCATRFVRRRAETMFNEDRDFVRAMSGA